MIAVLAMLLAVLSYSFFPLAASTGIAESTPISFVLVSSVFGFALSALAAKLATRGKPIKEVFEDILALPGNILFIGAISGTTANLGNILFIMALGVMSKAGATIIMESWPIISMFLAPLVIDKTWQRLKLTDLVFGAVAMAGIVFISASGRALTFDEFLARPFAAFQGADLMSWFGIILAFMGSFCFALSGIYRAEFSNKMPPGFKGKYNGDGHEFQLMVISEAVTKFFYLPIIIIAWFALERDGSFGSNASTVSAFWVAFIIVAVNILYSFALLKTETSSINILWYLAPLLAVLWLALFGMTEVTQFILIGGALIIGANLALALRGSRASFWTRLIKRKKRL